MAEPGAYALRIPMHTQVWKVKMLSPTCMQHYSASELVFNARQVEGKEGRQWRTVASLDDGSFQLSKGRPQLFVLAPGVRLPIMAL